MSEAPRQTYETMKVLAGLLESELELPPGRVALYNQPWEIPTDDGLVIEISFLGSRPYAAVSHMEDREGTLVQVQEQVTQETIGITLFSKGPAARERKHEIVFALQSVAAQQLSERYSFRWGYLPTSFTDASETEGAGRLNKYATTFNVLRIHTKEHVIQYFDKFSLPTQARNLTISQ